MKRMVVCVALLGLLAAPAMALHIIDDFSEGTNIRNIVGTELTINAAGTAVDTESGLDTDHVIGGERRVSLSDYSDGGGSQKGRLLMLGTEGDTASSLSYSNDDGVKTKAQLNYGYNTAMDEDLSTDDSFYIKVETLDLDTDLVVSLWSGGNTGAPDGSVTNTVENTGTFWFAMADFGLTQAQLEHIGRIQIEIDGTQSGGEPVASLDLRVSEIGTTDYIPEPATLSLLGLGALAAFIRRRRK